MGLSKAYRLLEGMNSLLAVLVLVHIHDAEAKGRALRCYFTDVLDITLGNRVHEELLRSTNYRFPTQKQREEQEKRQKISAEQRAMMGSRLMV